MLLLILMCSVVWAEMSGVLPFHPWHAIAIACLVLIMVVVSLKRRIQRTDKYKLLHPRHVREVAEAIDMVSNVTTKSTDISECNPIPANIPIGCTSLGIQISVSKIKSTAGYIYHYALSYKKGVMSEEKAKTLSRLILQLRHPCNSSEVIKGNRGVLHLLVHP